MTLEILSAEEKVYCGEVDSVVFPGSDGEFQILLYLMILLSV